MKFLKQALWGMAFGVASVVPGLSGATIAVVLGFFDRLVEIFANPFKNFKKNLSFLVAFAVGGAIGVIVFAKLISWLFEVAPVVVGCALVGLILGSLPMLVKKANTKKANWKMILGFLLGFIVVFSIGLLQSNSVGLEQFPSLLAKIAWFAFLGFLCGVGPAIPGLSGSLMLLVVGGTAGYQMVMDSIGQMNLIVLVPFGVGVVLSVVMLSRILKFAMTKFQTVTDFTILGFVAASGFLLCPPLSFSGETLLGVVLAVVLAIGVFFLSKGKNI